MSAFDRPTVDRRGAQNGGRRASASPEAAAPSPVGLTRRRWLGGTGGALVVGFAWPAVAAAPGSAADGLPGSLKKQPMLDGWIRIDADGRISVCTGKAELGQGISTALRQIAADELAVEPERIRMITPDTDRTPDEGYTAGSHSMQDGGSAIRHAAAQVRGLLLARAAERLAVDPGALTLADASVRAGDRRLGYGELVDAAALHVEATPDRAPRAAAQPRRVGRSLPRLDIPAKLTGGVAYLQDIRLPGMVHGRVVRPPAAGATLEAFDPSAVERMPGVLKVVRDGRFVAVVAEREFQAILAARAMAAGLRWGPAPAVFASVSDLSAGLRAAPSEDTVILEVGDPATVAGTKVLEANFDRPYQLHGAIGPSCAIARRLGDRTTVLTHTQGVFPLRSALAELLRVDKAQVRCVHVEGSGCYGHNGADDVAADAALLARALPGRPVRVQWMREDEHGWEPFGPAMTTRVQASLDAAGRIANWSYDVWSPPHNSRPGSAGELLAGTLLAEPFTPQKPKPLPQPEGGGDRNAIPLYRFPNTRVVHHFLPAMPVRSSALRSLGAYMNVYSIESFIDELARAAKADPVDFRLAHLEDPRAAAVVRSAAEGFGWRDYRRRPWHGRGFAFARYKNLGAYAAIACEVEVRRDTGEIRVERVVAAVDSGEAVNPDGIVNQIEGGIVQSTSWTLIEELPMNVHGATAFDWGGYPILRFDRVPERVEVRVLDRPGQPFLGTGEAAQGPTAAAIANAVADACGARLRTLPLSAPRVRAALGV